MLDTDIGTEISMNLFAIVPIEAARDHRLNASHYRILIALLTFRNKDTNLCCPSRAALGQRSGYSIAAVSRYTTELSKLGWLEKNGKGGNGVTTRFRITVPTVANLATVAEVATVANPATQRLRGSQLNGCEVRNTKQTSNKQVTDNHVQGAVFDQFWSAYPKKQAKAGATKIFLKLHKKDPTILAAILQDLDGRWKDTDPQFIPLPTTYLNNRRWEDEQTKPKAKGFQC